MKQRTAKYKEAEARVPAELRPVFVKMVECWEFHATIRHGRGWVSYQVIADMVIEGWRMQEGAVRP